MLNIKEMVLLTGVCFKIFINELKRKSFMIKKEFYRSCRVYNFW